MGCIFRYLDQLGMSAKYNTKTYCRQSFIGGNYDLLNTTTFQPNPDYYRFGILLLLWAALEYFGFSLIILDPFLLYLLSKLGPYY